MFPYIIPFFFFEIKQLHGGYTSLFTVGVHCLHSIPIEFLFRPTFHERYQVHSLSAGQQSESIDNPRFFFTLPTPTPSLYEMMIANIKIQAEVLVGGVMDQDLDSKLKLKMQTLDCLTGPSKGYGTQVTVKACGPLVL